MVRETRYLQVGNIPDSSTEDEVTDYFKRYGKIQKVIINPAKEQKDEKDTTRTATVAFTDIKSASNAHKAEKKIGNNVLTSEYSEGFAASGTLVKRTHEPEVYPRPPQPGYPTNRKGFEEEVDGFDIYYGPTTPYNEGPYPAPPAPYSEENRPSNFPARGRPRERTWIPGVNFHGRGSKWTGGTMRIYADSVSKDVTPVPVESPISVTASTAGSGKKKKKKRKTSKDVSRSGSRSSSGSSRRSSSSGSSRSPSSSTERKAVASTAKKVSLDVPPDNEIEPGEREPLGIYITKLPLRSSDTSLRDGLFHEYKKYGKVTAVQVCGVSEGRYAIVSFKQGEDAQKALVASQGKRFFGAQIEVAQHEGIEVDDADLKAPEVDLDEHHPKATRTLFIGNLEKEITIEELKEKLKTYGEILDVDVKRQGAVSAYAFIQFSDISSVVRALRDLEGSNFGVNKVKLGFGKSMATSCIWLDNLAESVNEGFLCRQFGRFGGISHAVVDRTKNRGLVFFMNIESAQYALPEMRNRIWNGKKVHIDFASRDCQESFFAKMEASGQLQPGERPDPRWMNKQMANDPHWDDKSAVSEPETGFEQVGSEPPREKRRRIEEDLADVSDADSLISETWEPSSTSTAEPHQQQGTSSTSSVRQAFCNYLSAEIDKLTEEQFYSFQAESMAMLSRFRQPVPSMPIQQVQPIQSSSLPSVPAGQTFAPPVPWSQHQWQPVQLQPLPSQYTPGLTVFGQPGLPIPPEMSEQGTTGEFGGPPLRLLPRR